MQSYEQQLMLNDSKFRNYANLMDKALKGFEYTNEWADLISALAKINKVVSTHRTYSVLPKKVTVGKRLAQCLHPALPAGVHIKALELYETIFNSIGAAHLAKDFPIYSAGLLPLLSHAAMTVKPSLLKLYETFVLPISAAIKPAAAGVILGILPGVEEGSEFNEWTNSLLDRFSNAFGVEHFYSNFWSCLYSNSNIRLAGTSYLLTHIDKSRSMEDQLYLLGTDLGLLVAALKACLEDSAVLVQRNTLDILSIALPFHDSQLTRSDQSEVIESALLVLLRRDMSLNRRLYAWLLGVTTAGTCVVKRSKGDVDTNRQRHDSGSSSASEPELEYFNLHSRRLLVQSLRSHLDLIVDTTSDIIKPLRVIMSLLDRVEIGSVVLEDILVTVFRFLRRFYSSHTEKQFVCNTQMCTYILAQSFHIDLHSSSMYNTSSCPLPPKLLSELLKTCNLLFGTLEPNFIWEFLADTYEKVLWPSEVRQGTDLNMSEYCDIVNMILSIASLETYVETQTVHLPRLLYNLLNMLKQNLANTSLNDVTQVLLLCRRLVGAILPVDILTNEEGAVDAVSVHDCVPYVQDILSLRILVIHDDPDTDVVCRRNSLLSCCLLLIEMSSFPVYVTDSQTSTVNGAQVSGANTHEIPVWVDSLLNASTGASTGDTQCQYISAAVILDLIKLSDLSQETGYRSRPLHRVLSSDSETDMELVTVSIRPLIENFLIDNIKIGLEAVFEYVWSSLDLDDLIYSDEWSYVLSNLLNVTSSAVSLGSRDSNSHMQTIIIKDLTHKDNERRLVAYKKFSLFWHQTRSLRCSSRQTHHILMAVLSSLVYEAELIQEVIRDWITHSVQCDDINRILEPFLILLLESDTSRTSVQQKHKASQLTPPTADVTNASEDVFRRSLEAAEAQITAIGSDGRVLRARQSQDASTHKSATSATQSLVTKEGMIRTSHLVNEPLDCENARQYISAGLALNPFGTASELDHLIFDGFTPHEALKNRWLGMEFTRAMAVYAHRASAGDFTKEDYHSVISRAKRLDRETCEREGIVFGDGIATSASNEVHTTLADHTSDIDTAESSSAVDGREYAPTNIIPLPDKNMPHRVIEEPPPLFDPEIVEIARDLVDDIITQVTSRSDSDAEDQVDDNHMNLNVSNNANQSDVMETVDKAKQVPDKQRHDSVISSVTSTGSASSKDSLLNEQQTESQNEAEPFDKTLGSHAFVLLYDQCYDCGRVQFALSVIQSVIDINPSLILSSLTTSTCSDTKLLNLLARHKKALGGDNYYTELTQETITLRNTRLLEILVTVCLYFWRSYLPSKHSEDGCVAHNSQVQLKALHLLTTLISDLSLILADSPKGFPQYMVDVLHRCKVVKTCIFHLQCLLGERQEKLSSVGASHDSSVDVPLFRKCLQLTENLIGLESKLQLIHENQTSTIKGVSPALFKRMMFSHPFLISTLNKHLSEAKHSLLHHHWLSMITNSLPHVLSQPNTADILQTVVVKTCEIFDKVSVEKGPEKSRCIFPPDYVQQLLEDFTVICHFCFMDVTSNLIGQSGVDDTKPSTVSTGQILSNLVSVFNPLSYNLKNRSHSEQSNAEHAQSSDPRIKCRDRLLSMLPKILASVSNLWRVYQRSDNQKVVQLVVEFFSPILHNYAEQLLGSVAVVWSDSQEMCTDSQTTQATLVELLISIKALPMDTIVDKLSIVMRKPPNTDHQTNARVVLQLSCLKFLRGYIIKTSTIPKNSMSSVCCLLKQCLQLGLPAPGVILLLETVTEFVYKLGTIDDRKIVKDLQEIVGKVLEACCQIISSQLEASSWTIRRNYTVKVKAHASDSSNDLYALASDPLSHITPGISVEDSLSTEEHESEYTSHALALLAEVTAGLLDVVYPSEDKDKVAPLLANILTRIFPYLRNHSLLNMTCYQSGCKLLASISSYQYTRRTWRREIYDLLLSPDFFRIDVQSLQFWKILADNLITHEKTMFKDLLARFMITGNATIQLFSTKDSELIQRAHNLKKLSFLIYCGDVDHYKHFMPDIQERLAENLRLTQAPNLLSQVFLCFRVLLLRISPSGLTSLWPTIITELVHVMSQIEQDLSLTDEEEQQMSRVSEFDSFSNLNEASVHHSPSWLQLYLSACKLLDLLIYLPSDVIPDFQHYTWMFTGTDDSLLANPISGLVSNGGQSNGEEDVLIGFAAHIPKLARMISSKFGDYRSPTNHSSSLLLQQQTISSLRDLQPFFARLLTRGTKSSSHRLNMIREAEIVLDNDLVEPAS